MLILFLSSVYEFFFFRLSHNLECIMSTAQLTQRNPSILWAQRSKLIYLTVEVEDLKIEKLTVEGNKFIIKGAFLHFVYGF